MSPFETVALPPLGFEASAAACAEADAIVTLPPYALYRRLLADQESEAVHVAARRVLDGFLRKAVVPTGSAPDIAAAVSAAVSAARAWMASQLAAAPFPAAERAVVMRERAPLALLAGCWLDVVSQPATQPSVLVNRLLQQHFGLRGEGNPARSLTARRRRDLERAGVFLPDIGAERFLDAAAVRPLTALHGCFYLALSRLPGNFLPELAGVHYAWGALGVDDLISGTPPALPEPSLREVLSLFLESADADAAARMVRGAELVVELEREHVAMLTELADWQSRLPLEAKVAAIVAKHAGYAGGHHHRVRVAGRSLADTFADPDFDVASFLARFRESPQLRGDGDGDCVFIRALKLGGPMFGIFDAAEAQTLRLWAASVQAGARPSIDVPACTAGDSRARARAACVATAAPADLRVRDVPDLTDRELFYRLVNIENYPNTRRVAFGRASAMLDDAEVMFDHGAGGRYTDASWFDYSPRALYDRAEAIYRSKLLAPYRPLDQIPGRDEVIFLQTTYALGALVDAAWIHRVANLGRHERDCDGALLAIYADEMGHGDMRKNHITLIYRALSSMGIDLPHIRDHGFMTQADLPDDLYGFSLHQLCMALFPDTFYCEILGYNLAIEMFGLGELRLHEIQKLRHYGFDDGYERAHLTIDNLSAGHSKQAADIIVCHLDRVRRTLGEAAVREQWRRVWRGYASLAYIVEHVLVKDLRTQTVDVLL
jgi:hypothetical protein